MLQSLLSRFTMGEPIDGRASPVPAGIVGELVHATAKKSVEKKYNIDNGPPLDLWYTTPRNVQEFRSIVQKIRPFATSAGQVTDQVNSILNWDRPADSLLVCMSWILLCSYPYSVFYLPTLALLCYSLSNWYARALDANLRQVAQVAPQVLVQPPPPPKSPAMSRFDLASLTASLQKLQNSLGGINRLAAQIEELHQQVDWTDEDRSLKATLAIIASIPVIALILYLIPISFIVCVAGLIVLVSNTPIFQAVTEVTLQVAVKASGKPPEPEIAEPSVVNKAYSSVFVYENQRWILGLGWGMPLPGERPPFSDASGLEGREMETMQLPEGETWAGDWEVDLGVGVDAEGWEYANQLWNNWGPSPGWTASTRRRRWKRAVEKETTD
eukprot:comp19093_c0_seq1/m.21646 comp19093_c0_seq1/g.21646  ORF comp19093_c0_seq1/g.21646 comp19093_c0_seq1/m.21646 type:complete len:384 (-) comp19093_c0_seq1:106-1257(-)